ncbi:MAG: peptidyl-prolyl cis-trans isomerase [Candidatus Eisenbacteria bacterium]|nr:peptidyl-prolyl cis-trans isomerase [Candidatus Eisenbacteria bacterium]
MTRRARVLAAASLSAMVATFAVAAPPAPARAPARAAAPTTIATVGDQRIDGDELDHSFTEALDLYRARNGVALDPQVEPVLRRQVLENLIRQRLLALEAKRRDITVSDEDAEAELKRDPVFRVGGAYSESRFLTLKTTHPDSYARSMAAIKINLASRRAGQEMDREVHGDDAPLRARVEREMTKTTIEYLALRGNEMDGSYVEPRESEILAWHRAHGDRFRLPEQAVVSILPIRTPAIADSAGATDAGVRAWDQAMRARADSVRAAIRAGARFDDVATRFGGAKRGLVLSREGTGDLWRGTPGDLAAALAAAPGTVLAGPVHLSSGWGIVRVEATLPARIAPLEQISKAIRDTLRAAARSRIDDRDLTEIYASMRDSLKTDAWRLRFAFADTSSFTPPAATEQDIEAFYRAHLADYSTFDRATSQVIETPLAQVRESVRERWTSERRMEMARAAADRVVEAWSKGRRDAALEKSMSEVRDAGIVPIGTPPTDGALGGAMAAELAKHPNQTGVTLLPAPGGFVVLYVVDLVHGYAPTFEQARERLMPRLQEHQAEALVRAARVLYDRDSLAFSTPTTVHFMRMIFEPVPVMDVPLNRGEVNRYYRAHMPEYTVEELVHIRHILISPSGPSAAADAAARQKAEEILRRVRAGEDFPQLAAQYSDDPATRDDGGDVGMFRHGVMRDAFERAAFAMRPHDIAGPVKTDVGYHILECLEYLPPVIHPLREVYANVAHDCALAKAKRVAAERADSVLSAIRTVAQAKEAAERLHLTLLPTDHAVGTLNQYGAELRDYMRTMEQLKPGQLHPRTQLYEGLGTAISWVDGITPSRLRPWTLAIPYVVQRYRIARARATLLAKKAELDSMSRAGWSFDSLGTLWGGLERLPGAEAGGELRAMSGRAILDSLAFGGDRPPVLETGHVSDWIEFPGGFARVRVSRRVAPDPDALAKRLELRRQIALWHRLNDYFDKLKDRYPVRILDGELRSTALPEPTVTS